MAAPKEPEYADSRMNRKTLDEGAGGKRREDNKIKRESHTFPGRGASSSGDNGLYIRSRVTGTALLIQNVFRKRLPYPLQWNILLSVVSGSAVSYMVTKRETGKCMDQWIYLEKGQISQLHDAGNQQNSDNTKRNKYGEAAE
ncbi:transmembrane protein 141 isoform X1 [Eleutherodactylus coqui]|uniref:transmembrane protein 141 isoform X1 n=1 Tax=Eleutherodactylus coqui TaxID=57060 RepID=UPI003463099F